MDHTQIEYKLDTILSFGKHKGKSINDILQCDPTYIYWMYDKKFKLTLEVRKASNARTKQRMSERDKETHPARRVQAEHYESNVKVYGPGLTFTNDGKIITNHEQGLRDLKHDIDSHMFEKHPEILDAMEDDLCFSDF